MVLRGREMMVAEVLTSGLKKEELDETITFYEKIIAALETMSNISLPWIVTEMLNEF